MDQIAHLLVDPAAWVALVTLIVMEVVLGIDNLIFISILVNKLPDSYRDKTRVIGIGAALIFRLALLSTIAWLAHVQDPLFAVAGFDFSVRDLILIAGGLFLLWKSTVEIHEKVDPRPVQKDEKKVKPAAGFASAIAQIIVIDMVFSIDSILTAVGMSGELVIMVVAVVVAVLLMLVASGPLASFIGRNPTIVMLALGFLLMIGVMLIADGFGYHLPRGYIYAAMGFSAFVELLNMAQRRKDLRESGQAGGGES